MEHPFSARRPPRRPRVRPPATARTIRMSRGLLVGQRSAGSRPTASGRLTAVMCLAWHAAHSGRLARPARRPVMCSVASDNGRPPSETGVHRTSPSGVRPSTSRTSGARSSTTSSATRPPSSTTCTRRPALPSRCLTGRSAAAFPVAPPSRQPAGHGPFLSRHPADQSACAIREAGTCRARAKPSAGPALIPSPAPPASCCSRTARPASRSRRAMLPSR